MFFPRYTKIVTKSRGFAADYCKSELRDLPSGHYFYWLLSLFNFFLN